MDLKLISNESGDWPIYEGHHIPDHIWIDLLEQCGVTVEEEEIRDEGMEFEEILKEVEDEENQNVR